jgi:hypothetical protein
LSSSAHDFQVIFRIAAVCQQGRNRFAYVEYASAAEADHNVASLFRGSVDGFTGHLDCWLAVNRERDRANSMLRQLADKRSSARLGAARDD